MYTLNEIIYGPAGINSLSARNYLEMLKRPGPFYNLNESKIGKSSPPSRAVLGFGKKSLQNFRWLLKNPYICVLKI